MSPHRPSGSLRLWRVLTLALITAAFLTALPAAGRADTGGHPILSATVSTGTAWRTADPSAATVQQRLIALRYLPAAGLTGRWDYRTSEALIAFQAWEGLQRDGKLGPRTLAALTAARVPVPRLRAVGREVEVYRALGVTLLVDGGRVIRAIHSSSGRSGFTTPAGTYRVYLKSTRHWSTQYHVWLPYASFFYRGIAFHAYPDVPAYPASHGCVRIPAPDAAQLYAFASFGTPVVVF